MTVLVKSGLEGGEGRGGEGRPSRPGWVWLCTIARLGCSGTATRTHLRALCSSSRALCAESMEQGAVLAGLWCCGGCHCHRVDVGGRAGLSVALGRAVSFAAAPAGKIYSPMDLACVAIGQEPLDLPCVLPHLLLPT